MRILDIKFAPIKNAHLKLEYDDQLHEVTADINGVVSGIQINDHSKGLKVQFRGIDGKYLLIADHATLPLGRKKLTLTSRSMVLKGTYYAKPGAQRQTKKTIPGEIRAANKHVHIQPQDAALKPVKSSGGEPTVFNKETRIENGAPVQFAAAIFTEANLLLPPPNEKYRKLIIASAKRYNLTPQVLAALIDTEAAKSANGAWLPDSFNKETNAAGLTQFLKPSWLEMIADPRSLMNQRLRAEKRYDKIVGRGQWLDFYLVGMTGSDETTIHSAEVLTWRFIPEYSIDTAALYGRINLEKLKKRGINIDALAPEDLAKVIYLTHHEGAGGAIAVLKGTLNSDTAKRNLRAQIGGQAEVLFARFKNQSVQAYTYWLYELLIDKKINVAHFMVKADGVNPKNMGQIAEALGAPAIAKPAAKAPPKAPTPPVKAGAAEGWHDPLDSCVLRTAKLMSVKSAMFGMTRIDGKTRKPRPHQGIDLVAVPGTPIYAVAHGQVVRLNSKAIPGKGYGKTLTLAVDIKDLPQKQRELVLAQKPEAEMVYFFYAHLTEIHLNRSSTLIPSGTILGTSGDSGNANGMNTVSKGAHLHFEVRLKESPLPKLADRIDPKPFINHCN